METIRAERWLYDRLKNDATLSGLVGSRVYGYLAPAETVTPFVVFEYQEGIDETGMSATRLYAALNYSVKVVGQTTSFAALEQIADQIDALLHGQSGPIIGGGSVMECIRQSAVSMVEIGDGGEQYRHLGGVYRILVQ